MFDVENAAAQFVDEYLQREVEFIDVVEFVDEIGEYDEVLDNEIAKAVHAEVTKILHNVREGWLDD